MGFIVGQPVICIETWALLPGRGRGDEVGPVSGSRYHIRAIGVGLNKANPDDVQVLLEEIRNPCLNYSAGRFEVAFSIKRFRPLTEQKSSVSFTMGAPTDSEKWDGRKQKVRHGDV